MRFQVCSKIEYYFTNIIYHMSEIVHFFSHRRLQLENYSLKLLLYYQLNILKLYIYFNVWIEKNLKISFIVDCRQYSIMTIAILFSYFSSAFQFLIVQYFSFNHLDKFLCTLASLALEQMQLFQLHQNLLETLSKYNSNIKKSLAKFLCLANIIEFKSCTFLYRPPVNFFQNNIY